MLGLQVLVHQQNQKSLIHPHHDQHTGFGQFRGFTGDVPSTLPLSMHLEALFCFQLSRSVGEEGPESVLPGSTGVHINHPAGGWHRHTVPLCSHHTGPSCTRRENTTTTMALFISRRTDICEAFNSSLFPRSFIIIVFLS